MTVYNGVIADIKCDIICNNWLLISIRETIKYAQKRWSHFPLLDMWFITVYKVFIDDIQC